MDVNNETSAQSSGTGTTLSPEEIAKEIVNNVQTTVLAEIEAKAAAASAATAAASSVTVPTSLDLSQTSPISSDQRFASNESSPYSEEKPLSAEEFSQGLIQKANAHESPDSVEDFAFDKIPPTTTTTTTNDNNIPNVSGAPNPANVAAYFGDPMTTSILDYNQFDGEIKLSDSPKKTTPVIDHEDALPAPMDATFDVVEDKHHDSSLFHEQPPEDMFLNETCDVSNASLRLVDAVEQSFLEDSLIPQQPSAPISNLMDATVEQNTSAAMSLDLTDDFVVEPKASQTNNESSASMTFSPVKQEELEETPKLVEESVQSFQDQAGDTLFVNETKPEVDDTEVFEKKDASSHFDQIDESDSKPLEHHDEPSVVDSPVPAPATPTQASQEAAEPVDVFETFEPVTTSSASPETVAVSQTPEPVIGFEPVTTTEVSETFHSSESPQLMGASASFESEPVTTSQSPQPTKTEIFVSSEPEPVIDSFETEPVTASSEPEPVIASFEQPRVVTPTPEPEPVTTSFESDRVTTSFEAEPEEVHTPLKEEEVMQVPATPEPTPSPYETETFDEPESTQETVPAAAAPTHAADAAVDNDYREVIEESPIVQSQVPTQYSSLKSSEPSIAADDNIVEEVVEQIVSTPAISENSSGLMGAAVGAEILSQPNEESPQPSPSSPSPSPSSPQPPSSIEQELEEEEEEEQYPEPALTATADAAAFGVGGAVAAATVATAAVAGVVAVDALSSKSAEEKKQECTTTVVSPVSEPVKQHLVGIDSTPTPPPQQPPTKPESSSSAFEHSQPPPSPPSPPTTTEQTIMGRKNNRRDNATEFENSGPDAVYEYVNTTLGPMAAELVYWRDPKASGVVFGAGLAILFSLTCFSVISVVSNTLMLAVLAGLSVRIYKNVEFAIKKTESDHPFKEYLDFEFNPSKERTQEIVDQLVSQGTCFVNKMRSVLLVEDLVASIKYLIVFWLFTYIGAWFNGMTLIILSFIGAFSLPKVYENNKSQIDSYLDLINGKINEVTNKVPFLKKAEAEKEE